jgi:hypothetical protein
MRNIKYKFKDFLAEGQISEGSLSNEVDKAVAHVEKMRGNGINISDYGLEDVADHIDSYSSGREIIYTSKTIKAFKALLKAMSDDEIANNQWNDKN